MHLALAQDCLPGAFTSVPKADKQTEESYKAQQEGLHIMTAQVSNVVEVGAAGMGKMTVLQLAAVLIGFSMGYWVLVGGVHFTKLLCIPAKTPPLTRLAEIALRRLECNPALLHLLRTHQCSVLCRQFSRELVTCIDIILHQVWGSNLFFGGLLVVATMDNRQLQPVDGHPPLLSPYMITNFAFHRLRASVRYHTCEMTLYR